MHSQFDSIMSMTLHQLKTVESQSNLHNVVLRPCNASVCGVEVNL